MIPNILQVVYTVHSSSLKNKWCTSGVKVLIPVVGIYILLYKPTSLRKSRIFFGSVQSNRCLKLLYFLPNIREFNAFQQYMPDSEFTVAADTFWGFLACKQESVGE